MKGFYITIKDNFLDKDIFKKLHEEIATYRYSAGENSIENIKHIWFACKAGDFIKDLVRSNCEKILNKKFKVNFCSFTLLSTVVPVPHCDLTEDCDYQVIVYIKGNENLNKGTGFYSLNEETNNEVLNTHVGFKENRAVLWHANTIHTPMNWSSDDKSKRYSIICQLKEKSLHDELMEGYEEEKKERDDQEE